MEGDRGRKRMKREKEKELTASVQESARNKDYSKMIDHVDWLIIVNNYSQKGGK